jgi:hypothetical protein
MAQTVSLPLALALFLPLISLKRLSLDQALDLWRRSKKSEAEHRVAFPARATREPPSPVQERRPTQPDSVAGARPPLIGGTAKK